ncbi:MAG: hypothetical protein HY075_12260 [Deltaproteobacteria bacterium]|nr:hypothetical protein [Deltaproteobacteria bacterium]
MKLPYDALSVLQRSTEARPFAPVHELVRKAYRGPLRALAREALAVATGERRFDLVVRHSAVAGAGFNAFGSDIDLTVVFDDAFSLERSDRMVLAYERLRRVFPPLGELEIFSRPEWERLSELWREHGAVLRLIRDLKKIRWMEWKLVPGLHEYHRYKVKSAIRRLLVELEGEAPALDAIPDSGAFSFLRDGFERRLRETVPVFEIPGSPSFAFRSHELDATICGGCADAPEGALVLPRASALALAALLPSHHDEDQSLLGSLGAVRADERFRRSHAAALSLELLYANAAPRVHPASRERVYMWIENLEGQLRRYSPDPAAVEALLSALNRHPAPKRGADNPAHGC